MIADLELPLHRLSTRLTSLDEVFLEPRHRGCVVSDAGGRRPRRGLRPRLPALRGPAGRAAAATFALYKASIRRALGLRRSWRQKVAPFVLLGVVTIPAIINVGIGYVTRNQVVDRVEIVTYRDYVGVSSALLLFVALVAPDVVCPDRRQRVLPLMFARPLTGVDYVRRQGRGDRHDPVRLLVPAPGRAVRRQHARQRQRARVLPRPPRRAVEGPASPSSCSPCTTP